MIIANYAPSELYLSSHFVNIKSEISKLYGTFDNCDSTELVLSFKDFTITLDDIFQLSIYYTNEVSPLPLLHNIESIIKKYLKNFHFKPLN